MVTFKLLGVRRSRVEIDVEHGRCGHVFLGADGLQALEFVERSMHREGQRAFVPPEVRECTDGGFKYAGGIQQRIAH